MFTLLALLFTLRTGTIPALSTPASIALRAESREIVNAASRHVDPLEPSPLAAAPQVPQFPYAAPGATPVFAQYRPEEWVARVASQLNVADLGITHAAMWLCSTPVRLDVSSQRFFVTVTVRAP